MMGNPWFWFGLSLIFVGFFILGVVVAMKRKNR
jgi:hypothetical protein